MRIAIVRLSAMGDIIQSMLVVQIIKSKINNVIIDWIVDESFSELVSLNDEIDNVISLNLREIKLSSNKISNLRLLYNKLKNIKKYDLIIDLQGLIKSAIIARIIKSDKTIGYDWSSIREPIASILYSEKYFFSYFDNVFDRYLGLVSKTFSINIKENEILNKKPIFVKSTNRFNTKRVLIGLVVGASFKSKIYSVKGYKEVINSLDADFICLWGSEEELIAAKKLKKDNPRVKVPETTSFKGLIEIINSCSLVIGGDTGPTHLAWAQNIPSITLFGATPGCRNMMETDINKKLESGENINLKKISKINNSIDKIKSNDIVNLAKKLIK